MNRLGVGIVIALAGALLAGCGGAPEPRASAPNPVPSSARAATKQMSQTDPCEQRSGQPPPEPLEHGYSGVAAKARCQAELNAIMADVSHALGVECAYCHLVPDYRAMTPRKQIANWMATELVPALRKKDTTSSPECSDCHMTSGKGVPKFLGDPRNPSLAAEWMTTHLVEDFETKSGSALKCKGCHGGNLGTPQFHGKIMLSDLPALD